MPGCIFIEDNRFCHKWCLLSGVDNNQSERMDASLLRHTSHASSSPITDRNYIAQLCFGPFISSTSLLFMKSQRDTL